MAKYQRIEDFDKIEVDIKYDFVLEDVARQMCDRITDIAYKNDWKDYAFNWQVKKSKGKKGNKYIVHNKDTYRLTHLLENGHLIVNKKGGIGWSSPRPHIEPTYNKALNDLDNRMNEIEIFVK